MCKMGLVSASTVALKAVGVVVIVMVVAGEGKRKKEIDPNCGENMKGSSGAMWGNNSNISITVGTIYRFSR